MKKRPLQGAGRASAVGIELALAVMVGLLVGWWADGKLGTDPWLTLLGLLLGSAAGFRSLMALAKTDEDEPGND